MWRQRYRHKTNSRREHAYLKRKLFSIKGRGLTKRMREIKKRIAIFSSRSMRRQMGATLMKMTSKIWKFSQIMKRSNSFCQHLNNMSSKLSETGINTLNWSMMNLKKIMMKKWLMWRPYIQIIVKMSNIRIEIHLINSL